MLGSRFSSLPNRSITRPRGSSSASCVGMRRKSSTRKSRSGRSAANGRRCCRAGCCRVARCSTGTAGATTLTAHMSRIRSRPGWSSGFQGSWEGRTLCQIAERLTSEGVPKPTGRGRPRWAHQTIRWILKTPHYAGEVHWWRRNRSANKAAGQPVDEWRPLDEQVAMPAECIPALVDKETFEIVQERLRSIESDRRAITATLRRPYCVAALSVAGTAATAWPRCTPGPSVAKPPFTGARVG